MHRYALTLALLIGAEQMQDPELAAYIVIDKAMTLTHYSDDRKADLYARIEESVKPGDTIADMQVKISACLKANDLEFINA